MTAMRVGFWLGWKIESNWTDPLLFFIYAVARPLGAALILVAMFFAVSAGERGPLLDFLVVGSAAWPVVVNGLSALALAVIEDREHWRMITPIYTAPITWSSYLIGRCLARVASVGASGLAVTMAVGVLALGVDLHLGAADVAYATVASALGLVAVVAIGLLAVAYVLGIPGEAWHLPEALSASLYLVCGAVFPVAVLPGPLQAFSRAVPITWWLEGLRRALLGDGARLSFPALSDGEVLALLAGTTAATVALAAAVFTWAEQRARRLGVLDRQTGY